MFRVCSCIWPLNFVRPSQLVAQSTGELMTVTGLCRCPLGSSMVLHSARPKKGPHITVRAERAAGRRMRPRGRALPHPPPCPHSCTPRPPRSPPHRSPCAWRSAWAPLGRVMEARGKQLFAENIWGKNLKLLQFSISYPLGKLNFEGPNFICLS
jgi:hypothetical protein